MENAQKRTAADGETELPEEIIHHIQSLLFEKEAARSTLLSKSWHRAWCTLPNLRFKQSELRNRVDDEFPRFTKKIMQRYEDLNLKIKSFTLIMIMTMEHDDYEDHSQLARELILKAIKLGAVDLTVENSFWRNLGDFVLPDEVLESETLTRLSVFQVKVDLERMINKPLTLSSNLKSLTLSETAVKSDLYLQFPCLKTLVIRNCYFKPNVDDVIRICSPSLECLTIWLRWFSREKLELDVPNIRKLKWTTDDLPCLEMKASSREWESDIHVTCSSMGCASWLHSLKQFVKSLSPSRVSLALHIVQSPCGDQNGYVGDGLAIPAVENLTIRCFEVLSPAFLNALFWSCRPNFVNIERRCVRGMRMWNSFNT